MHHSDCGNSIYQIWTPDVLLLARIKAELLYLAAKKCVIYYHNSNPITLHCWWTVWMTACSFIHSHLWPELHNGSSLKFTLHTSEWESSVFDGQLTHLCGIKAIRFKGRQNGTRSEVWARTGCLWLSSLRDVCSGACRSDWLFMHIRSVAERCYFYEGIWVYKDIQSWENAAKRRRKTHWNALINGSHKQRSAQGIS